MLSPNALAAKKIRVMIDPGHGGEDNGACHQNIKEKNLVLKVSMLLRNLLQKDPDFETTMTREKDDFIPLEQRPELAAHVKADIFLSIHANSSPSEKVSGTEFYFENQVATDEESLLVANRENTVVKTLEGEKAAPQDADVHSILSDLAHSEHMVLSQELSQKLMDSFQKRTSGKHRAIRQAPFRVLSVGMPATLVELGYITNPQEAAWLNEPKNQQQIAEALYQGLKNFKHRLQKARASLTTSSQNP
jgi:N-acetylmuramoyl-L-alanine amidase